MGSCKGFQGSVDFWHRSWLDNGCPHHDLMADIKRKTHAKYNHTVKFADFK